MKTVRQWTFDVVKTIFGCALFGFGFSVFLAPCDINAGGLSGMCQILVKLLHIGTVGSLVTIINIPLFVLAAFKLGKKFFFGSFVGMAFISIFIDLFALLPPAPVDRLLSSIYGGVLAGVGIGIVYSVGMSTGGSDIVVRILKKRWQNIPIGRINIGLDLVIAALTGLVFHDVASSLYSGVAIFVTGRLIDVVVYSFDYSKVALIITAKHKEVADKIDSALGRGVTFLNGEGYYSGHEKKVILTAVKKQQLAELKQLVSELDPDAFVIVQEAHQVLGDGFSRYNKDAL